MDKQVHTLKDTLIKTTQHTSRKATSETGVIFQEQTPPKKMSKKKQCPKENITEKDNITRKNITEKDNTSRKNITEG